VLEPSRNRNARPSEPRVRHPQEAVGRAHIGTRGVPDTADAFVCRSEGRAATLPPAGFGAENAMPAAVRAVGTAPASDTIAVPSGSALAGLLAGGAGWGVDE